MPEAAYTQQEFNVPEALAALEQYCRTVRSRRGNFYPSVADILASNPPQSIAGPLSYFLRTLEAKHKSSRTPSVRQIMSAFGKMGALPTTSRYPEDQTESLAKDYQAQLSAALACRSGPAFFGAVERLGSDKRISIEAIRSIGELITRRKQTRASRRAVLDAISDVYANLEVSGVAAAAAARSRPY